jgi:Fe-S cluster assembly iron-binding protein IscA
LDRLSKGGFAVLTITPKAAETIERILASPEIPDGAGVRISPTGPAMNGANGEDIALTVAEEPDAGDQVIEQEGARVFVQETLAGYLDQMSLDANVVEDQIRFMVEGPADAAL